MSSRSGARRARGLTRPELAILLAYSKIWLNTHLLDSDVPEDPYLSTELERYFPAPVRRRFARAIAQHRLRREIIATATTNSLSTAWGRRSCRARRRTRAPSRRRSRAPTRAAREIFEHARRCGRRSRRSTTRCRPNCSTRPRSRRAACCGTPPTGCLPARARAQVDAAVAEFRAGVHELEARIGQVLCGSWRERFEAGARTAPARRTAAGAGRARREPGGAQRLARHRRARCHRTASRVRGRAACTSRSEPASVSTGCAAADRAAAGRGPLAGDGAHRPARCGPAPAPPSRASACLIAAATRQRRRTRRGLGRSRRARSWRTGSARSRTCAAGRRAPISRRSRLASSHA